MPRRIVWLFLPLLFSGLCVAKDKSKSKFPAQIVVAQYVQVTTYFGDDPVDLRITVEDRRAIADVEAAIRKWGRYHLVYRPEDAELIIVVRKGRLAEVGGGIGVHGDSRYPNPVVGSMTRAEVGDPIDTLSVYDPDRGSDSSPLWRGRLQDGLDPPEMELVKELREKVEAAAKKP
jgi:hypothetical protein